MKTESQGNVIGPPLGNPNSCSGILSSSWKILCWRYSNGSKNASGQCCKSQSGLHHHQNACNKLAFAISLP
ncbi:hypothetical protein TIFTF001_007493 [Ficus carica]|uniref:Uncharacterized protein n=1 Tax=Ficus carica TaxID=3494 RepID=A0AA88CX62_FICCA|nr:hypothetical protein TIFTF001_007493 [Ficus carica]